MDVEDAGSSGGKEALEPRFPNQNDLVAICGRLNELGALYIIVEDCHHCQRYVTRDDW